MLKNKIFIFTGFSLSLSSCYFNSAGHIFDKAAYNAVLTTQDLKANNGSVVYTDGNKYYIEVLMGRYDKPVKTQYDALEQKNANSAQKILSRTRMQLVEIPENFAFYLMGKRDEPKTPSYMYRVKSNIKEKCHTYAIKKTPESAAAFFRYKSPGALGYYTLGVLDWLCVDLPVTCVENAIAIPCYTLFGLMGGLGNGLDSVGKGLGRMGNSLNKSAAQMNNNYSNSSSHIQTQTVYQYAEPVQTSEPVYTARTEKSYDWVPPIQTESTSTFTPPTSSTFTPPTSSISTPSFSTNLTPQQVEMLNQMTQQQREMTKRSGEIFDEYMRDRKENFNNTMNIIKSFNTVPKY